MILPYGSDQDDGYIGYHSIGIILLCFLGFALTWPREVHLQETLAQDSVKVWYENEIADQEKRFPDDQTPGIEDSSEFQESNSQASIDSLDDHRSSYNRIAERVASFHRNNSPLRSWGLSPSDHGWFPGIITHMFLHAGWMHLLGNMLFFFAFGVAMEHRFGWKWFLFLYLVGGMFSGLCQIGADSALRHGLSTTPLVGASGAIAAAMGAFLRSYPTSKIKAFIWIFRPITGKIHAWLFLGFWFLTQFLYSHFATKDPSAGVAYIAHVSGFFFGFVAAQFLPVEPEILERERPSTPSVRSGIVSGFDFPAPPARLEISLVDQAWDAARIGDNPKAIDLLARQFSAWIKSDEADLGRLDRELSRLAEHHPQLRFAPLPAWEWGMRLSETEHAGSAQRLLRMALQGTPPLTPALAQRAESTLERLSSKAPPPSPPHQPPPRPPTSPTQGSGGRPGWLVD